MQITCPSCGFARDIDVTNIPDEAADARCPGCGHVFQFQKSIPDPSGEFRFEPHSAENDDPSDTPRARSIRDDSARYASRWDSLLEAKPAPAVDLPWENIREHGLFQAFRKTLRSSSIESPVFFRGIPKKRGLFRALSWAGLIGAISQVTEHLFSGMLGWDSTFSELSSTLAQEGIVLPFAVECLAGFLVSAAVIPIFVFLFALGIHLSLRILRAGGGGFTATVKAVAYSCSPAILIGLPIVGPVLFSTWSTVNGFIALRNIHGTSYIRVILSYFLTMILIVVTGFSSGILLAALSQ